jgi:hypothetical protein
VSRAQCLQIMADVLFRPMTERYLVRLTVPGWQIVSPPHPSK